MSDSTVVVSVDSLLTAPQKEALLRWGCSESVDRDLLTSLCARTSPASEEERDDWYDVISTVRKSVIAKAEDIATKEKRILVSLLESLSAREAVGNRPTIKRALTQINAAFTLAESDEEEVGG